MLENGVVFATGLIAGYVLRSLLLRLPSSERIAFSSHSTMWPEWLRLVIVISGAIGFWIVAVQVGANHWN